MGSGVGVAAVSACMSATRGSGVLTSTGDVLEMSVVRGVGGVCDMCMCLARSGVGGEWVSGWENWVWEYRFSYKAPWECRTHFSRFIISTSLSHNLVRMANTHDHEHRPSAHPYRMTENGHLISRPAYNLHQPQEG